MAVEQEIEWGDVDWTDGPWTEAGLPLWPHEGEVMKDDGEGGEASQRVELVESTRRLGGQANCSRKRMSPE